jgi:ABC-type Fe3+-siderophore transport system permease subunit
MNMRIKTAFLVVALILAASIIVALTAGQYHISLETLWKVAVLKISGVEPGDDLATPSMVLWSVRMPRVRRRKPTRTAW